MAETPTPNLAEVQKMYDALDERSLQKNEKDNPLSRLNPESFTAEYTFKTEFERQFYLASLTGEKLTAAIAWLGNAEGGKNVQDAEKMKALLERKKSEIDTIVKNTRAKLRGDDFVIAALVPGSEWKESKKVTIGTGAEKKEFTVSTREGVDKKVDIKIDDSGIAATKITGVPSGQVGVVLDVYVEANKPNASAKYAPLKDGFLLGSTVEYERIKDLVTQVPAAPAIATTASITSPAVEAKPSEAISVGTKAPISSIVKIPEKIDISTTGLPTGYISSILLPQTNQNGKLAGYKVDIKSITGFSVLTLSFDKDKFLTGSPLVKLDDGMIYSVEFNRNTGVLTFKNTFFNPMFSSNQEKPKETEKSVEKDGVPAPATPPLAPAAVPTAVPSAAPAHSTPAPAPAPAPKPRAQETEAQKFERQLRNISINVKGINRETIKGLHIEGINVSIPLKHKEDGKDFPALLWDIEDFKNPDPSPFRDIEIDGTKYDARLMKEGKKYTLVFKEVIIPTEFTIGEEIYKVSSGGKITRDEDGNFVLNGKQKLTKGSGEYFKGEFKNNVLQGIGVRKWTFSEGIIAEGMVKEGKQDGLLTLRARTGATKAGRWSKGELIDGIETGADGKRIYYVNGVGKNEQDTSSELAYKLAIEKYPAKPLEAAKPVAPTAAAEAKPTSTPAQTPTQAPAPAPTPAPAPIAAPPASGGPAAQPPAKSITPATAPEISDTGSGNSGRKR